MSGFLYGASLKDDQFDLFVWLLLPSLLPLSSCSKALNFSSPCNQPISAIRDALGNIEQIMYKALR